MWLKRERFEVFSKGSKWHKLGIIGKALRLPSWLNKKASSFPSKNLVLLPNETLYMWRNLVA